MTVQKYVAEITTSGGTEKIQHTLHTLHVVINVYEKTTGEDVMFSGVLTGFGVIDGTTVFVSFAQTDTPHDFVVVVAG